MLPVALCEVTILANLTLLTIVVAAFVFVSSVYKGAIELSAKQHQDVLMKRKDFIQSQKEQILNRLAQAGGEQFPQEMNVRLKELSNSLTTIDSDAAIIQKRARAIGFGQLVSIPGVILLSSIVASAIAIGTSGLVQFGTWSLSIALMIAGLWQLYRILKTIERVSAEVDIGTFMERALQDHQKKNQPYIRFDLWNQKLEVERGKLIEIEYNVSIAQGDIGRNCKVTFTATHELEFQNEEGEVLTTNYLGMTQPKRVVHSFGDLNPLWYYPKKLVIKAPSKTGKYVMTRIEGCEGYTSNEQNMNVTVV